MWSSRSRSLAVGSVAAAAAGGWLSVQDPPARATVAVATAPAVHTPSLTTAHEPMLEAATAPPGLPAPARGARRITPAIRLPEQQQQMLALDPVVAARASVDATRDGKRADCKNKLPHATDEYCERILQVDGRTGVKFIQIQQAFLTGQIDQDTYQAETHKVYLEHEIALENFMPPRDFLAHEGLPPGEDIFVAVMGEFQSLPAGYKMGDELFDPSIDPFASASRAVPSTAQAANEDPALRAQKEQTP